VIVVYPYPACTVVKVTREICGAGRLPAGRPEGSKLGGALHDQGSAFPHWLK
jgi:hypothetical protein